MVNLIKETLKDEGLKMDAVASGEKALQLIEKNEYILIILDIGLSGKLNGWDIVEKLKSKQTTANIPIIISSIYENKERARKNGITNYLVKPFTPLQLKQIVKKACNGELDCKMMVKENESDIKSLIEDTLANKGLKVSKIEYCGNVLIITFKGGQRS